MSRDYNGTTDRLDWASFHDLTAHPFTISTWVYWDAETSSGFQYLVDIHGSGDTGRAIYLMAWQNAGTSRALQITRFGVTNLIRYTAGNVFAGGEWEHILVTSDGTFNNYAGTHVYVNGVEVTYAFNQNGATETAPTGKLSLGGRIYDDVVNFDGKQAETAVWLRVLDSTERAALAAGLTPDDIPTDLAFYYSAKTNTTVAEVGGAAATVDGTSYSALHPTMYSVSPSASKSPSTSQSPSVSPSASKSPSSSVSPSVSPSSSESPSISPSASQSPSASASPSSSAIEGSVTWGHATGVVETNALTFSGHWTGTGSIQGSGDSEELILDAGEYMESDVVETSTITVQILQNNYQAGDTGTLKYRHGATEAACLAASWVTYSTPFDSLGFIQVRLEGAT